jgi:hypothetical protein
VRHDDHVAFTLTLALAFRARSFALAFSTLAFSSPSIGFERPSVRGVRRSARAPRTEGEDETDDGGESSRAAAGVAEVSRHLDKDISPLAVVLSV